MPARKHSLCWHTKLTIFSACVLLLRYTHCCKNSLVGGMSVLPKTPRPTPSATESDLLYFAYYKPALTLCSLTDDKERAQRKNRPPRPTILPPSSYSPPPSSSLHICGRLDRDSEGLLLLTTDGSFTARVCGTNCRKVYWALVQRIGNTTVGADISTSSSEHDMLESALARMRLGGLDIRGKRTRPPESVKRICLNEDDSPSSLLPPAVPGMSQRPSTSPHSYCWLEIILTEGRNRQVRRTTADAGYRTIRLVRVAVGNLQLFPLALEPGEYKKIRREDVLSTS